MNIIFELPSDEIGGGVERTIRMARKIIFELPHNNTTSGGVRDSVKLASKLKASLRFQRLINGGVNLPYTVGLPDFSFPECDICVTYSDNPHLEKLVALPQVGRVYIYMMSWGMCFERERPNVHNPNVTVMCTTKKIQDAIEKEGVEVHRIGFDLDMKEMHRENWYDRSRYLAILYHDSKLKNYDYAVRLANELYKEKQIDGVITFGGANGYENHTKPIKLIKHIKNASREQVRDVFNNCRYFLNPSLSEGLNLTPIESTLCGCPAILTDGAIGEIFFNEINCFVEKDKDGMKARIREINDNYIEIANSFHSDMVNVVKDYTIDKVVKNLKNLL
jgi:glycosyltransferase involved in cell wall biosynthesis